MRAVENEQAKLLATALNNVAVACVVIGFVTPMTALSSGVASAQVARIDTLSFSLLWLSIGITLHFGAWRAHAEPQAMTFDRYSVTSGIPAITSIIANAAVLSHEWAARRLDHSQPGE